ncbi:protein phosphatase CheZ [Varunaivibrio sulfuroxidans]|uniref:Chemotaxis protein CheZ n=1 Tax=Varunaivibrio sulfuroxidans TaxID=1773489 RepID=A0A4R3JCZ9_9PROT|nr:protein phosphatase CheZ [Varunaivibrio sulfuroxidans]TCS63023.1 chemotaxis protein CheZ [Varunaivibrio sulfuroxidans]WES31901.1 protein phosphatase CheZ [Varunaivibrio sulfuroxidans]
MAAGKKKAKAKDASGDGSPDLAAPSSVSTVGRGDGVFLNIDVERQKILFDELEDLALYIRTAKQEIARLRPDEVTEEYLPAATDELDAIVKATAEATNTIMDAVEVVENVMGEVADDPSKRLMEATTHIYEACSFQDITGQRIGKVVTTLKHIEEKIDALVEAFGDEISLIKKNMPEEKSADGLVTDKDLLEGPQLGDAAKSQSEIDDLLAGFD